MCVGSLGKWRTRWTSLYPDAVERPMQDRSKKGLQLLQSYGNAGKGKETVYGTRRTRYAVGGVLSRSVANRERRNRVTAGGVFLG